MIPLNRTISTVKVLIFILFLGFFQSTTATALQLHDLSKNEYKAIVRFLRSGEIEKIWIKSHNVRSPACMIDVRNFHAVFLNGNYLSRTKLLHFVPICPIVCLRQSGVNVCS